MIKKANLITIFLLLILYLLLIYPYISIKASLAGVELWMKQLLPVLFPFMFFSELFRRYFLYLTKNYGKQSLVVRLFQIIFSPIKHLWNLSDAGCICFLTGIFCGFPLGARTTAFMIKERKISQREAEFLLPVCNIASPAFILSYFINGIRKNGIGSGKNATGIELLSIYLPIILWGFISAIFSFRVKDINEIKKWKTENKIENKTETQIETKEMHLPDLQDCMVVSLTGIGTLLGYVIVCSVFSSFLQYMFSSMDKMKAVISVLVEISTGLPILQNAQITEPVKLGLELCAINFGGLSFLLQTSAMIEKTGLSILQYFIKKAIITVMTALVFILFYYFFY